MPACSMRQGYGQHRTGDEKYRKADEHGGKRGVDHVVLEAKQESGERYRQAGSEHDLTNPHDDDAAALIPAKLVVPGKDVA